MQGTGTLTAYAGQTITFSGSGTFFGHNYEALFAGTNTLTATMGVPGVSTLTGTGYLSGYAQQAATSTVALPALVSKGGDYAYAESAVTLPALTAYGESGFYIPGTVYGGFVMLPALTSAGLMHSIGHMQGDVSIPALLSKGGDYAYGEGVVTIPALFSSGAQGYGSLIIAIDRVLATSTLDLRKIIALAIIETARASDSITSTRVVLISVIDSVIAADVITIRGVYSLDVIEAAVASSVGMTQTSTALGGLQPAVDSSRAVWCVNLETNASSQYEGFGFNSFFERDGKYYGIAEDGVYQLDGDTAADNTVSALIDFGQNDCGLPGRKKILNIHIGTSEGSDMYLKVETTTGTNTYQLEACLRGTTNWRAQIPPNVQDALYRFTLIATKEFELDGITFRPARLSRRI